MSTPTKPTPLIAHTLETLCDELVSGRAIVLDEAGRIFQLASPRARAIFNWYCGNREKWEQNNRKEDVEATVDAMLEPPPSLPATQVATGAGTNRVIHLKSVRIHRFAGIQKYGTVDSPPPDFYFVFEKPLTLIHGENGAGKTSLLSAITWCLTGMALT